MNLADSIFIFGLALIIFGPKKLPEIGRQIGKIMLEFRRASNEFKMQIEEELRTSEQADRQKQLAERAAKDSVPPASDSAAASEPLTVRPPSTGATESTASPFKAVSTPDETVEPTGAEPATTDWNPAGDPVPPSTESGVDQPAPVQQESTPQATSGPEQADLRIGEAAQNLPSPTPYAAEEPVEVPHKELLQEQTINHHG